MTTLRFSRWLGVLLIAMLVAHQETLTRVRGSITIDLGWLFAGVFGRFPLLNSTFSTTALNRGPVSMSPASLDSDAIAPLVCIYE